MNLQPRRAKRLKPGEVFVIPAGGAFDWGYGETPSAAPVSIWRMELPNTSYTAPQAAFWWVSNDK